MINSQDQQLLEEAYKQIRLNEFNLSKLNPFKKAQPAAASPEQPKQPSPQQKSPKDKFFNAVKTLVSGAKNIEVKETSALEGDKHDSTMYFVNGKKIVDMSYSLNLVQILNPQNPNAPTTKVDINSGAKGLDQIYNALRDAGAAFNSTSEDHAYHQFA